MSPSRLASISFAKKLIPVALVPGWARLSTKPNFTGSSATPNTIGIVAAPAFAARDAGVLPDVAMTATLRWTASVIMAGNCS